MKFLFVVQGEGRGHMTQAIALQNLILKHGHEVSCVMVGKNPHKDIPTFFYNNIKCEIVPFESPYFITDKDNRSMNIWKTIIYNLSKFSFYYKNLSLIDTKIKEHNIDTVINFYDFLCGVYFMRFNPSVKLICIGHQYLSEHSEFVYPDKVSQNDKFWYLSNTWITSSRASKKLALSFRKMPDILKDNIYVVPPLLRKEALDATPSVEDYILVYMVNAGFSEDIIAWHKEHPEVAIQLFCDRNDIEDGTVFNKNLTFNKLNDKKFLESMKSCKAYASTAGFESICEAMYMGKPILMVPPEGHFEQSCNALDAQISGAGIQSDSFDLAKLIKYIPYHHNNHSADFKNWVNDAENHFAKHLFGN